MYADLTLFNLLYFTTTKRGCVVVRIIALLSRRLSANTVLSSLFRLRVETTFPGPFIHSFILFFEEKS